jgi:hypothetical protein
MPPEPKLPDDKTGPETPAHVVVPARIDLKLSLGDLPSSVATLVDTVANPPKTTSLWKTLSKDYFPVLTPAAAVVVSFLVFYYTNQYNDRARVDQSAEAMTKLIDELATGSEHDGEVQDTALKEELAKKQEECMQPATGGIVEKDFAERQKACLKAVMEEAQDKKLAQQEKELADQEKERTKLAMKVAVYGDRALPAVRMALGADDPFLRNGGVLVAEQMAHARTVDHWTLTEEMLKSYDNPHLRGGVLEWLVKAYGELTPAETRMVFDRFLKSFGDNAKDCAVQDTRLVGLTAKFLYLWSLRDPRDVPLEMEAEGLILGMVANCTQSVGPRVQALSGIPKITNRLVPRQRALIRTELVSMGTQVSDLTLRKAIEQTAQDIHGN